MTMRMIDVRLACCFCSRIRCLFVWKWDNWFQSVSLKTRLVSKRQAEKRCQRLSNEKHIDSNHLGVQYVNSSRIVEAQVWLIFWMQWEPLDVINQKPFVEPGVLSSPLFARQEKLAMPEPFTLKVTILIVDPFVHFYAARWLVCVRGCTLSDARLIWDHHHESGISSWIIFNSVNFYNRIAFEEYSSKIVLLILPIKFSRYTRALRVVC